MALPRIRTWKCRRCERQLYSQHCLDCDTDEVLPMVGPGPLNVEIPTTVSEFALGDIPPIPGSSDD